MHTIANLFDAIPAHLTDELSQALLTTPRLRIERIVSHGHNSPPGFWYDQDHDEWVLLLSGAARLQFDNEVVELKAGSFVNIAAHRRHRVEWTASGGQPTIWLAIHYRADGASV
jgi:cupin 2 domain-containing protein